MVFNIKNGPGGPFLGGTNFYMTGRIAFRKRTKQKIEKALRLLFTCNWIFRFAFQTTVLTSHGRIHGRSPLAILLFFCAFLSIIWRCVQLHGFGFFCQTTASSVEMKEMKWITLTFNVMAFKNNPALSILYYNNTLVSCCILAAPRLYALQQLRNEFISLILWLSLSTSSADKA